MISIKLKFPCTNWKFKQLTLGLDAIQADTGSDHDVNQTIRVRAGEIPT